MIQLLPEEIQALRQLTASELQAAAKAERARPSGQLTWYCYGPNSRSPSGDPHSPAQRIRPAPSD
jgi:hypothetical protein